MNETVPIWLFFGEQRALESLIGLDFSKCISGADLLFEARTTRQNQANQAKVSVCGTKLSAAGESVGCRLARDNRCANGPSLRPGVPTCADSLYDAAAGNRTPARARAVTDDDSAPSQRTSLPARYPVWPRALRSLARENLPRPCPFGLPVRGASTNGGGDVWPRRRTRRSIPSRADAPPPRPTRRASCRAGRRP